MMNKKRKEHSSFAIRLLTTVTVVFATSPLALAAGGNDGAPCVSTYHQPCSSESEYHYNNIPPSDSMNNHEAPEVGSEQSGTAHNGSNDNFDPRNIAPQSGFFAQEEIGEELRNTISEDGTPALLDNNAGVREPSSKKDGSQTHEVSPWEEDTPIQPTNDEEPNETTHTTAPVENEISIRKSPDSITSVRPWLQNPNRNPQWYNDSKDQISGLQENVEGRKIFRGTERFMQCTGYTTLEWDKLVNQQNLNSETKWQARFAKLYDDYVLSAADEGLHNEIDADISSKVHQFIESSNNSECLVKTEGLEEKYFINSKFAVNGTFPVAGGSQKEIINCSFTGCAQKYLNPTDNKSRSLQRPMMEQNRNTQKIKANTIKSYMRRVAENAQHALDQGRILYEQLKTCEVYAATTSGFDYTDPYYNNRNTKSSFDKKLTCYSVGVETQDFPACVGGINAYDAIFAGRIVVDEAQKLEYMDHSMDAQAKATQSIGKDATAALKFQKDDLKKQAQMQSQKAAIEGAALGTMTKFFNDMPTREDLKTKCSELAPTKSFEMLHKYYSDYSLKIIEKLKAYDERHYIQLVDLDNDNESSTKHVFGEQCGDSSLTYQAINIRWDNSLLEKNGGRFQAKALSDPEANKDNTCESFIYQGKQSLISNVEAKDGMKQSMVKAGVDIASYLGKAALLKKQAGKIDSAVKQVESFQPTDVAFESGVPSVTDCFKDPEAEGCKVNNDGTIDFYDGSINLGGTGGATIAGGSGSDSSGAITGSNADPNRNDVNVPVGTPIASVNKASGDFESRPAGALGMKKTGGGAAGGGGGGGASAVAPPGGGSRGGGGPGGSGYRGSRASKLNYSGGGSSLSYSSGARRSKAKKSKSSNPFSKLFGKKKGKGGVLNFRDTASGKQISGKNGDLFNMISQRYGKVSQKKRLQEYESVK